MRGLFLGVCISWIVLACDTKDKKKIKIAGKVDSSVVLLNYNLNKADDSISLRKALQIKELLQTKFKDFNGAVLVSEKGRIIYDTAIGFSDFQTRTRLNLHSSFHLASVSKQFTAMGIMMLEEAGKLSYDDPAVKFIPKLPYKEITIRQLLNHTSGLPNITNYLPNFLSFWDSCEIAGNEDIVYVLNKNKPSLQFKPGTRFSYNNTGYILLGLIVEKVSGMPFDKFITERIFKPLHMDDSRVYSMINNCEVPNRVYGFSHYRGGHSPDENDIRNGLVGEKGVYSSVIDLYKWDQALYTDVLVSQKTIKEAFDHGQVNSGRKINYGFGWRKAKTHDDIVYHFGHWRGFKACIIRFTNEKNLIVILNNTGSRRLKQMALSITDIVNNGDSEKGAL
ncbi:MAG TPA: serine hydrolase domain-containing protein [Cytophagaceae bacterium]|nr:serine hydrolase domain-containing protein [Cytophagaceae bacterium]